MLENVRPNSCRIELKHGCMCQDEQRKRMPKLFERKETCLQKTTLALLFFSYMFIHTLKIETNFCKHLFHFSLINEKWSEEKKKKKKLPKKEKRCK